MRKLKQSLQVRTGLSAIQWFIFHFQDSTFLFAGAALRKHIKYDEFLANTSDNEEDADDSCTEMENDFNLPEVGKYKPVTDPRGSRRVVGQAPDYRPGVIVKIQSEKDLPTPLVLRNRFSEYGCVAYVDRYGPKNGFIRFNNQSGAQRSIEKEDFYTLSLLTGQKEEQYWESLLNKVGCSRQIFSNLVFSREKQKDVANGRNFEVLNDWLKKQSSKRPKSENFISYLIMIWLKKSKSFFMFPSSLTDKSSLAIFLKLTFMLLHKNNLPEHCSFFVSYFAKRFLQSKSAC